jgi:hypothetical protein
MDGLGHSRYGAYGADFGAGVVTSMALSHPERLVGIHLGTAETAPYTGPGAPPLTREEQAYVDHVTAWDSTERGYSAVQSTRPQTLGYALTDSPAGLAAWVLDKWRSWSDSGGDVEAVFGRDSLLTLLTVYWVTGCITPSMRDYYDNRWHRAPLGPDDVVRVPTAFSLFPHEFVPEGSRPGPGTSGSTPCSAGPCTPGAGTSRRRSSRTSWPTTSSSSSPACADPRPVSPDDGRSAGSRGERRTAAQRQRRWARFVTREARPVVTRQRPPGVRG